MSSSVSVRALGETEENPSPGRSVSWSELDEFDEEDDAPEGWSVELDALVEDEEDEEEASDSDEEEDEEGDGVRFLRRCLLARSFCRTGDPRVSLWGGLPRWLCRLFREGGASSSGETYVLFAVSSMSSSL